MASELSQSTSNKSLTDLKLTFWGGCLKNVKLLALVNRLKFEQISDSHFSYATLLNCYLSISLPEYSQFQTDFLTNAIAFLVHSFHRNNGSKTTRILKKYLSHICNKKKNPINQRLCTQFSGVDFLKVPYAGLFMW